MSLSLLIKTLPRRAEYPTCCSILNLNLMIWWTNLLGGLTRKFPINRKRQFTDQRRTVPAGLTEGEKPVVSTSVRYLKIAVLFVSPAGARLNRPLHHIIEWCHDSLNIPKFCLIVSLAFVVPSTLGQSTTVQTSPTSNQVVNQPQGTSLSVNALTLPINSTWNLGGIPLTAESQGFLLLGNSSGAYFNPYQLPPLDISAIGFGADSGQISRTPDGYFSMTTTNGDGIALQPGSGGDISLPVASGASVHVNDTDLGNSSIYGYSIFCVNTFNDYVGVAGPNACNAYDLFDVSNRETLGNGYMHWYADGEGLVNAGISNSGRGVLSFDTFADNNGLATVAMKKLILTPGALGAGITFPDGSVQTTAATGTSAIFQANGNSTISGELQVTGNTNPNTSSQGAYLGWNALTGGTGETDFINNPGIGPGGFAFFNTPNSGSPRTLLMFLNGSGNLGIGTASPSAKLEVDGNVKLTAGSGASITFPDGTVQATAYTGTCVAAGGDYAESIDVSGARGSYEPGDVIVIDPSNPSHFQKSGAPYSRLVAGIYSTKPGYVGRRQIKPANLATSELPMAMIGIVPTKVTTENGPINVGDLLVTSSKSGYAMKGTDPNAMTGAVVGKALGQMPSGTGMIEVLVSLQ